MVDLGRFCKLGPIQMSLTESDKTRFLSTSNRRGFSKGKLKREGIGGNVQPKYTKIQPKSSHCAKYQFVPLPFTKMLSTAAEGSTGFR